MASFKNIDPFTFLGVICDIPSNEIITAGKQIDYNINNLIPEIEIASNSNSILPPIPLPVIPREKIVIKTISKPNNFWFWLIIITIMLVGTIIIGYLFWKEKKEDNQNSGKEIKKM